VIDVVARAKRGHVCARRDMQLHLGITLTSN